MEEPATQTMPFILTKLAQQDSEIPGTTTGTFSEVDTNGIDS